MKVVISSILFLIFMSGCQSETSNSGAYLMNQKSINQKPVSNKLVTKKNVKDKKDNLELSKINAHTKIEIEKIKSTNRLLVAKIQAQTNKEIAYNRAKTKVQTTEIDAIAKKEATKITLYITITILLVIIIALYLFYLNSKHNRELKEKLHKDKLTQEMNLKSREHHEQRVHKMLDMVADGKLSPEMQEEIIVSISKENPKTIEFKQ